MEDIMLKADINHLEEKLEIKFNDKSLLLKAVTHKSFPNENPDLAINNNERLEFLGDSVLGLSIASKIFEDYEEMPEGGLAKMRAVLVSAVTLARKARDIDLSKHILLGRGEEMTGGRERDSILADALEAIFGAIYLDQGFKKARLFINEFFDEDIELVKSGEYNKDFKTVLQEYIQQNSDYRPEYNVVEEIGPDHNKEFKMEVLLDGKSLGEGSGSTKKSAEQRAAKSALINLGEIEGRDGG